MSKGLLFIPDISGFTKFVNETEIEHSRFIIEELLENIINSNQLGLTISEIEGDAVLFFKFGDPPSTEEIYQQVEKMFCNFQKQIKNYEIQRVCPCTACKGAVNLSLKVITHYGEFSTYNVREYNKLIGKDVILAHQLLKNDIDLHEYWLVTSDLYQKEKSNGALPEWMQWQQGNKQTDNGDVGYQYSMLSQLKEKIEPDPLPEYGLGTEKVRVVSLNKTIDKDLMTVFATLGDFSLRPKWQEGVKTVDQVSHPIYHVGIKHRCVLDKTSMVLYTSSFSGSEDSFSLTETDEKKRGEMNVTLKSIGENKTLVNFDYYLKKNPLMIVMFNLFMKKKLNAQFKRSLDNLEALCLN
jgi:hypothetical protein